MATATQSSSSSSSSSSTNPYSTQEFLAESTLIEITPFFDHSQISLIDGNYGPFVSQLPVKVPLWLAGTLKTRHMCKVSAPVWMSKDFLLTVLTHERDVLNSTFYAPDPNKNGYNIELPHHYVEISRIIMKWEEDIDDVHTVRTLIADIESVRASKVRESIRGLSQKMENERDIKVVKATGMGSLEIQLVRPFVTESLRQHYKLSGAERGDAIGASGGNPNAKLRGSRFSNARRHSGGNNDDGRYGDDDDGGDDVDDDDENGRMGGISMSQFSQESHTQSQTQQTTQHSEIDYDDDDLEEPTMAKTKASLRRFK